MDRRLPKIPPPIPQTWKAAEVMEALIGHLMKDIYNRALFKELELEPHHEDEKYVRRADLLAIFPTGVHKNCRFIRERKYDQWESYPFRQLPAGWRCGFEIKVSRGDLIADLKQTWKQKPLSKLCNEIYLVYPRGAIKRRVEKREWQGVAYEHEVSDIALPWGMGAIEVWRDERPRWLGNLRARIVKLARYNMLPETPAWFLNRLLLYYGRFF